MSSVLVRSVVVAVLVFVSASAFGTLSTEQKTTAEALVTQFAAPEFAVRQQAVDKLIALGPDVAPVVRDALAKTLDNEVKLRCEMVLKALRKKFGAEAVDGKTAAHGEAVSGLEISLEAKPAQWKARANIEFACTVKNVSDKPIRVAEWGLGITNAPIEVTDAAGRVLKGPGGRESGAANLYKEAFVVIEPGQSKRFILSGLFAEKKQFFVTETLAGYWQWELSDGEYTLRAVFAGPPNDPQIRGEIPADLWTGRAVSNAVKVTVGAINYDASRITLVSKQAPVADALEEIAKQSGNRYLALPGGLKAFFAKPIVVSFDVKDKPYWETLDLICRQAGYSYEVRWDPKSPVLLRVAPKLNEEMITCTGPVVVKLARVVRNEAEGLTPGLIFQTRALVEDRLPTLSTWVEFTGILTPDGVNRIPKEILDAEPHNAGYSGFMPWGAARMLPLREGEARLKGPVTVQGKACVEFAQGRRETKIESISLRNFDAELVAEGNGITLRLTKVEAKAGRMALTMELRAEGTAVFAGGKDARFGFHLADARGRRYSNIGAFEWRAPNNEVKVTGSGAPLRLEDAPGKPLQGKLTLSFMNLPAVDGDWTLVLVTPESVVKKEYPFTIKDVPLP